MEPPSAPLRRSLSAEMRDDEIRAQRIREDAHRALKEFGEPFVDPEFMPNASSLGGKDYTYYHFDNTLRSMTPSWRRVNVSATA